MPPAAKRRPAGNRQLILGTLVLAGLVILVYFPALKGGFIWDDDDFLTQNPLISAPDGLRRLWLTTQSSDYWPLTYTTLWLEWRIWGMNAAGYQATNVLMHIAESLILWAILRRLRIPGAYLAALFFALHPVNVESVVWITQRKNLVAMLFFLLSILCFLETGPGPFGRACDVGTCSACWHSHWPCSARDWWRRFQSCCWESPGGIVGSLPRTVFAFRPSSPSPRPSHPSTSGFNPTAMCIPEAQASSNGCWVPLPGSGLMRERQSGPPTCDSSIRSGASAWTTFGGGSHCWLPRAQRPDFGASGGAPAPSGAAPRSSRGCISA